ncbi:10601_t:CDS:2, partial [Funneliformis caledonium]
AFSLTFLALFLIIYTAFLIKYLFHDDPVMQHSTKNTHQIPVPVGIDIALDDVRADDSCNNYLIQPKNAEEDDDYYGYFTHENILYYEDPNINPDAIAFVEVSIDVDASIAKPESPLIVILDAEKNPLKLPNGELNSSAIDHLPNDIRECVTNNMYYVPRGQRARISFNRHLRNVINSAFKSTFGISSNYKEKPYIMSNFQTEPIELNTLTDGVLSSRILLNAQYFFINVETEQRTRTVFSMFGLVGGAYGIASALYVVLFGTNVIRPWGCVQYSCGLRNRTQNKLRKELPVIPLINSNPEILNISRENSREELIALLHRVNSLEVFLREYVVDIKYLKELKEDGVTREVEGNDMLPINVNYNHYNNASP